MLHRLSRWWWTGAGRVTQCMQHRLSLGEPVPTQAGGVQWYLRVKTRPVSCGYGILADSTTEGKWIPACGTTVRLIPESAN